MPSNPWYKTQDGRKQARIEYARWHRRKKLRQEEANPFRRFGELWRLEKKAWAALRSSYTLIRRSLYTPERKRRMDRDRWARTNTARKVNRALHPGMYNEQAEKSRTKSLRNALVMMICNARKRARDYGMPFDLDDHFEALAERFAPLMCEISGVPLDLKKANVKTGSVRNPYRASIDRINSRKGYTFDNVRFICWGLNAAFSDWGEQALAPIAAAWVRQQEKLDPLFGLI